MSRRTPSVHIGHCRPAMMPTYDQLRERRARQQRILADIDTLAALASAFEDERDAAAIIVEALAKSDPYAYVVVDPYDGDMEWECLFCESVKEKPHAEDCVYLAAINYVKP